MSKKTLVAMTVVSVLALSACGHDDAPQTRQDEFLAELHRGTFVGSGQTDAQLVQAGEYACAVYGTISRTQALMQLMQQYDLSQIDAIAVSYTAKMDICHEKYMRLE